MPEKRVLKSSRSGYFFWALGSIILLSLVVYADSIHNDHALDDLVAIGDNQIRQGKVQLVCAE